MALIGEHVFIGIFMSCLLVFYVVVSCICGTMSECFLQIGVFNTGVRGGRGFLVAVVLLRNAVPPDNKYQHCNTSDRS